MFCDQVRFSMHARCASISSGKHEQVSHRAKKNFLIHARMKQYTKPRALENKSCNYHCCLCLGLGESNQIPWGHFFAELSFSTAGLVNRQPARGCCWNAGSGWWHMAWPELSGWSCCSWFWWWSQCCCKWLHQKAWLQFYLPAPALAAAHLWNETNHWCTGSLKGPRFKLRNKRAILHVCIQLRQVHEPTKGRWCTTIAKLSAAVTGLPLVLHVSLPKTIFSPPPPTSYLQLWKWSLEYFSTEECFQLFTPCQNQWNCLGFRDMMKEFTNHRGNLPSKYAEKLSK